jgi:hypothetical protein
MSQTFMVKQSYELQEKINLLRNSFIFKFDLVTSCQQAKSQILGMIYKNVRYKDEKYFRVKNEFS